MKNSLILFLLSSAFLWICSCTSQVRKKQLIADFHYGEAEFFPVRKSGFNAGELRLVSRFRMLKRFAGVKLNTYMQYGLGEKIKLIIGNDTLSPKLSLYVPLIDEGMREIDCIYQLNANQLHSSKSILISDSLLDFRPNQLQFY